jgi:hypothetical protein
MDFENFAHHPAIDEIVSVLSRKTQNTDTGFFKIETAYFLAKIAASMRVSLMTRDRGEIPCNIYALALATSGSGKGYSVHILEESFLSGFKARFMNETFPQIADQNLWELAQNRAIINGTDETKEKEKLDASFRDTGALAFAFDSGTTAAVKQMREKLLMAKLGSINLQIDEIGSNLIGSTDILNTFLELYDQGIVKIKLTKNTKENQRLQEIDGKTPTNMLLFGTPAKLLDGGPTEDAFYSFLETGYARRCIFGMGTRNKNGPQLTASDVYTRLIDTSNDQIIDKWNAQFTKLADPQFYNWRVNVSDASAIMILEYKIHCERIANNLPDHEEIRKSEYAHRYAKMMKLEIGRAHV